MPPTRTANTKLYPRSQLRKFLKEETGCGVGKDVDIPVYLDYCLFIDELMKEASLYARERNESRIRAQHIEAVTEKVLRKFKG